MDILFNLLLDWGYWGMLLAAFLAGSFLPFSSELIMVTLQAAGLDSTLLVIYGTVGNVAGGMFNYSMGRLGNLDWIEKHLHVSRESINKAQRFMRGHGALMGFFAFIPVLGSAITITLGLTRANLPLSFISITTGKFLRYLLLIYGTSFLF
jgi:membrane protein YqaA with SNARE-associated domain